MMEQEGINVLQMPSGPISVDTFQWPLNYNDTYRDFVANEAKKMMRFIADKDKIVYLSDGKGTAKEMSADEIAKIAGQLDRYRLVTLWEVAPATYHVVARTRHTQLVLRNEIVTHGFVPDVLSLYPQLINLRQDVGNLTILVTLENVLPILYNEKYTPNLIYDPKANIAFSADGTRGVFGKVIEEVRSLLTMR